MSGRPESTGSWLSLVLGGVVVVVLVVVGATVLGSRPARPAATVPPAIAAYLVEPAGAAPPLALTSAAGRPFALAEHRDRLQLVFFGYTHCPDVCPLTMGIIGQALRSGQGSVEASFVTIDPERDTVAALADYSRYLPAPMTLLTGTPAEVRATADAWGVRYARVDRPNGPYAMSHTPDVYLVDHAGLLRARFPYGTSARDIERVLDFVGGGATAAATSTPTTLSPTVTPPSSATPAPASPAPASPTQPAATIPPPSVPAGPPPIAGQLRAAVVSSSVWAGGGSPVVVSLYDDEGRIDDLDLAVSARLDGDTGAVGSPVDAIAVRPAGLERVFYVARLDIPAAGRWRLELSLGADGSAARTTIPLIALDPGGTPVLGEAAPEARTPTLDDVGGVPLAVTTDPAPDLRLSRTSTEDALAAGRPFVLVVDSWRFQVTPACGKALAMARYLQERWPDVAFIHLEPYRYSVVTSSAVLDGRLDDPPLVPAAEAWGLGEGRWDALSMPWVFVVDSAGSVVAKYQGLVGSEDVDVILALLEG